MEEVSCGGIMRIKHLSSSRRRAFRSRIYRYFRRHGRSFSWRSTRDPYRILVSEVMLQQTQTDRVEKKFREFLAAFPGFPALAAAPLREVMRVWQGMGYNRRALYLHAAAVEVVHNCGGKLPRDVELLERLPGIGPATARSIAAFAFNAPVVFIETNIRTVYIHEFFKGRERVADAELLPLVEATLDTTHPRQWYNALMDYGVMLKERYPNPSRRSAHYQKQSPFLSSDRRIRGAIIRCLVRSAADGMTEREIVLHASFPRERVRACLRALVNDRLVVKRPGGYSIP